MSNESINIWIFYLLRNLSIEYYFKFDFINSTSSIKLIFHIFFEFVICVFFDKNLVKDPTPAYNKWNDKIDFTDRNSYHYPNKAVFLTEDVKGKI